MKEFTPYLNFDGNTKEVMTYYHGIIGGDLRVMTFGDVDPNASAEMKDRVMHARITNGSTVLMASDSQPQMRVFVGNNFWLNLTCESDAEVQKLYDALSAGGKGIMPPADQFWGAHFAMCADKYGMSWMLNHEKGNPMGAPK